MSETTGVTVSNFLAGLIATGVALVIIPNIIQAQIGGASQSQNSDSLSQVVSNIEQVCDGDVESTEGTVELTNDAVINLTESEAILKVDGNETEEDVPCSIREYKVLEQTEVYTVEALESSGGYDIR